MLLSNDIVTENTTIEATNNEIFLIFSLGIFLVKNSMTGIIDTENKIQKYTVAYLIIGDA